MVIKLHPENVSNFWPLIKKGVIEASRIPIELHEKYSVIVLKNLLSGIFQCWLIFKELESGERKIHTFLVTSIQEDPLTEEKSLSIDRIYGLRRLEEDLIYEAYKSLANFAKAQNCRYMRTYTVNSRVEEILKIAKFDRETVYYIKEI